MLRSDLAGRRLSGDVTLPDNIAPLPPKCRELNVMEKPCQRMRDS